MLIKQKQWIQTKVPIYEAGGEIPVEGFNLGLLGEQKVRALSASSSVSGEKITWDINCNPSKGAWALRALYCDKLDIHSFLF